MANLCQYIPLSKRAGLKVRMHDRWPIVVEWLSKLRRRLASRSIASTAEPELAPADRVQRPAHACWSW